MKTLKKKGMRRKVSENISELRWRIEEAKGGDDSTVAVVQSRKKKKKN